MSYKGELLFPTFVNYPEEKFGGFLAKTDYRDPFIQEEIDANGWMIWPPIRYSYRTVNNELPTPAPSKPWWLLSKESAVRPIPWVSTTPTAPWATGTGSAPTTRVATSSPG